VAAVGIAMALSGALMAACGSTAGVGGASATTMAVATELRITCDGQDSFPVSALHDPPTAAAGSSDLAVALRSTAAADRTGQGMAAQRGWRQVVATADRAGFVSAPSAQYPNGLYLSLARSGDRWSYFGSSGCASQIVSPDGVTADWALDPAHPAPTASDTQLHLVVDDPECNDGTSLDRFRVRAAQVTQTRSSVSLLVPLAPLPSTRNQFRSCPMPINGGVTIVVDLGRPLGSRQVLDGSVYPPRPATTDANP
jgi:hypothetical protein